MIVVSIILSVTAAVLLIPALVLFTQCVVGSRRARETAFADDNSDHRVAVLIPAHNEGRIVAAAVTSITHQLKTGDRVCVIADNCTDDTARFAREAGAEVTERNDPDRRGKGWALDHGVRFLESNPPDVVVLMDADCIAGNDLVRVISTRAHTEQHPIQADYRLLAPAGAPDAGRPARFAWRLKDTIRPQAMVQLGLPCQLAGSGMAFPWRIIKDAPLAGSDLVEDLKLGLDLAEQGVAPRFESRVYVDSELPARGDAQDSQKERWVQGHLLTIARRVVPMLAAGVRQRDPDRIALALDLAVLPFGLFVLLLAGGCVVSGLLTLAGLSSVASLLFAFGLALVIGGVLYAWWARGRDLVAPRDLFGFAAGLLGKIPLYIGVLVRRQKSWVRTERDD